MSRPSPKFEALWHDDDVARHADGLKRIHHPKHGLIELEFFRLCDRRVIPTSGLSSKIPRRRIPPSGSSP
ncbi:MmyB family transcriptional regulator [Sphingomonas prati]|uniref:MmyB family transcriptional regulator n=1 Tax=Sphingomonas prati TaxID=1843237 RepID=UPI003570C8AC